MISAIENSNSFQLCVCKLVFDVAGIQSRSRFEEQHLAFFFSERPVLDAAWNNDEFAGLDPFFAIVSIFAIVHAEAAFDHQKHLVFGFMMMPSEWAFEFDKLD